MFRILTEDINRDKVVAILSRYLDGYTLREGKGYWRGQIENSLTIEIDFPERNTIDCDVIYAIAKMIKELNNQESVLVQEINDCQSYFV